jgi:hypothetical protein
VFKVGEKKEKEKDKTFSVNIVDDKTKEVVCEILILEGIFFFDINASLLLLSIISFLLFLFY